MIFRTPSDHLSSPPSQGNTGLLKPAPEKEENVPNKDFLKINIRPPRKPVDINRIAINEDITQAL